MRKEYNFENAIKNPYAGNFENNYKIKIQHGADHSGIEEIKEYSLDEMKELISKSTHVLKHSSNRPRIRTRSLWVFALNKAKRHKRRAAKRAKINK